MPRGFGHISPEKRREIASMGGKAAHAQGRAHEFTSDEAKEAGRKGGETVSRDRAHMAEIGRKGGRARAANAAAGRKAADKPIPYRLTDAAAPLSRRAS